MPIPEVVKRLMLAALSVRLQLTAEPVYADIAWIGACCALIAGRNARQTAGAAMRTLELNPTSAAVWRFAWQRWNQRITDELLTYQADRLTPEWVERHVSAPGRLPENGCVLLSVHHYNQRLAFARLSPVVAELGAVAVFEPLPVTAPELERVDRMLTPRSKLRALSRFTHRVSGSGVYSPAIAGRHGLELLRRGGSLIVLADYAPTKRASVLGKQVSVAEGGAVWFAERSGQPVVPLLLSPRSGQRWKLWCGEPIAPDRRALLEAIENCVRRAPTVWAGLPWLV